MVNINPARLGNRRAHCFLTRPESIPALPLVCPVVSPIRPSLIADFFPGVNRWGMSPCAVQLAIIILLLPTPFPHWGRTTQRRVKSYTNEQERRSKAEFDKLDPPPSEFDVLEERLKLNFAIHDLEWSTAVFAKFA
jgi:hypothetical protein